MLSRYPTVPPLSTALLVFTLCSLFAVTYPGYALPAMCEDTSAHYKNGSLSRTYFETNHRHASVEFDLTYQEFTALYAPGATVEVSHKISDEDYQEGYVFAMDVTEGGIEQAHTFTFPEVEFDGTWSYRIERPEDTPYSANFPNATLALVQQFDASDPDYNPDQAYIEYYLINESGIYLEGYIEAGTSSVQYFYPIDNETRVRATFPLDESLYLYKIEGPFYDEDYGQNVQRWQELDIHAHGTLNVGNDLGIDPLSVGLFINDRNIQEPGETDPNTVIDFDTQYQFFAEDGTWLTFFVAQDPDLTEIPYKGEIEITDIELWRVTPASNLPVELVSFEGILDAGSAHLTWTTASETNNSGFDVERVQADGNVETLGHVPGHGTTLEAQAYSFTTKRLAPGTHRFRLKQIDLDGSTTYSSTVELAVASHVPLAVSMYPNPVRAGQGITLDVAVTQAEPLTVEVFDILGRRVDVIHRPSVTPGTVTSITIGSLASGLHLVRARQGAYQQTEMISVIQ